MKAHEQTLAYLKTLNLQGVLQGFDEMINDAYGKCPYRDSGKNL